MLMIQPHFSHSWSLEMEMNYTQVIPSHISAMIVINHLSHDFHPNHTFFPPELSYLEQSFTLRTRVSWSNMTSKIESASSYKWSLYGAFRFIKYSGWWIVAMEVIRKWLFESKTLNSRERYLISLCWLKRIWWFRSHNILYFIISYHHKTLQTVFSLLEVCEYLDFTWMGLY